MTASTSEQLARLISGVELLMLDFDGPICSVFAGLSAPLVAGRLRQRLQAFGLQIEAEQWCEDDPLSIYRQSARHGRTVTRKVHDELVAAEIEAVASAAPTLGAAEVLRAAKQTGRQVAIVSNNAAASVEAYVRDHAIDSQVDYVAARRSPEPELMKPNPAFLAEASEALGIPAYRSLLVGDSLTDAEAARRAQVPIVGFANKPGKFAKLAQSADAVIESMDELARALVSRRPHLP